MGSQLSSGSRLEPRDSVVGRLGGDRLVSLAISGSQIVVLVTGNKDQVQVCSIGNFDPDGLGVSAEAEWMRWKTYKRYEEKFDSYEEILDKGLFAKMGGL